MLHVQIRRHTKIRKQKLRLYTTLYTTTTAITCIPRQGPRTLDGAILARFLYHLPIEYPINLESCYANRAFFTVVFVIVTYRAGEILSASKTPSAVVRIRLAFIRRTTHKQIDIHVD